MPLFVENECGNGNRDNHRKYGDVDNCGYLYAENSDEVFIEKMKILPTCPHSITKTPFTMENHETRRLYKKYKNASTCTYCCIAICSLCVFIATMCWFDAKTIMYHGTIVANHYSWKTVDSNVEYAIHYYCTIQYNNNSFCELVVGKAGKGGGDDDSSQDILVEHLNKLCPINNTEIVYEYYFFKKCGVGNKIVSYNASITFYVFAGLMFLVVAFCACISIAKWHHYNNARNRYATIRTTELVTTHNHADSVVIQQNIEINDNTCSICQSALYLCDKSNPTKVFANEDIKRLDCNHLYHKKCIELWLQTHDTCPLCRIPARGVDCFATPAKRVDCFATSMV